MNNGKTPRIESQVRWDKSSNSGSLTNDEEQSDTEGSSDMESCSYGYESNGQSDEDNDTDYDVNGLCDAYAN
ncbi:hypothetical protein INT45_004632 [Circinella minor]|uniref:Uncharacterized protein n=1 Tax=Circinella minor TaxID=1195481 RepID=A0A8H7REG0_9FUNG|nr:hypothetical protein INT45_004632 [Circinella minor]